MDISILIFCLSLFGLLIYFRQWVVELRLREHFRVLIAERDDQTRITNDHNNFLFERLINKTTELENARIIHATDTDKNKDKQTAPKNYVQSMEERTAAEMKNVVAVNGKPIKTKE